MVKVSAALACAWQREPDQPVRLIVGVVGDLAQRRAEAVALGADVTHVISLTNTLSLTCTGHVALQLAQQPWVMRITPDQPVQAWGRESNG